MLAMTPDRRLVFIEDTDGDLARILVLETFRYELHPREHLRPLAAPRR